MTDKKLIEKLKLINKMHSDIQNMKCTVEKEKRSVESALKVLGMKIEVCGKCYGSGEEEYTYGYQDGCTGVRECVECKGTGYVAVEID